MNGEGVVFRGGRRVVAAAGAAAIVGVVALVAGAVLSPARFFLAYLAAYNFAVTTVVGALIFLMTCHAMHAGWPTLLRRLVEAVVATLPILAVLYVPLLFGLRTLYPWLRPETIASEEARGKIALKSAYLNLPWFLGRAALIFAIWIFVGFWLRRWSIARDRAPRAEVNERMYAMSGALLPAVGLAMTFAAFDWLMSLTPLWASTMYPVYYFAGGFVAAIALLTILTWAVDRAGLVRGIGPSHYYALGRLLLAFIVFWAYAAFFQLLLVWIANKPDEVTFYAARAAGGWRTMSVVLVVAHFVVPFFALLGYDIKHRPGPLAAVALWILAAHYLDVHWLVMPEASGGPIFCFVDVAALLAVGGVTVIYGVLRARGLPMVPVNDPRLAEALGYDSL